MNHKKYALSYLTELAFLPLKAENKSNPTKIKSVRSDREWNMSNDGQVKYKQTTSTVVVDLLSNSPLLLPVPGPHATYKMLDIALYSDHIPHLRTIIHS